jgi:hypothetical protein
MKESGQVGKVGKVGKVSAVSGSINVFTKSLSLFVSRAKTFPTFPTSPSLTTLHQPAGLADGEQKRSLPSYVTVVTGRHRKFGIGTGRNN